MASAVAGAIKWISSVLIEEGKYLYGINDIVSSLQKDLKHMQPFLQTSEKSGRPLRDDDPLLILIEEMRDLAIRAEDAVSIYRVDIESKVNSTNFLLRTACLASHSYPVHTLRNEIKDIRNKIEEAMTRSREFSEIFQKFEPQHGIDQGSSSSRPNPENFLHLNDEIVVGIEEDITNLVKRLINPNDDFRALGIVGTGGAGKSTLATQIYLHKKVGNYFTHKAFISVSQQWNDIDLLSRIYKQISPDTDKIPSEKNVLLRELHDFMKDKNCLIVLDDIWDKKVYKGVHPIFPPTKGIRVIITTRNEDVILHADTKAVRHKPKLLTKNEKFELFRRIAVDGRKDIENDVQFLKLGRQMLENIEGLPLAVVTLAGILRTKQRLHEWKRISEACSSNILKEDGGLKYGAVNEMLGLSYLDLPTYVKPCFLYLAIIPEDQEFACDKMTQMWIAEGLITDDMQMGEENLEDVAMRVLDILAQRCIIQVTNRDFCGQAISFRMHDLMREFCVEMANRYNFIKSDTATPPNANARRLLICSREYIPRENQHLRALVYDYRQRSQGEVTIKLDSIDKRFKLLRVLSIYSSPRIRTSCTLPKHIEKLIYLTYLSLVNSEIAMLPESIRKLRNLLYFEYTTRTRVRVVIPHNLVGEMENLRLLELPGNIECGHGYSLGLSSERHKKLHTFKCGAGTWMNKDLLQLSSSVLNLQIYSEIQNPEQIKAIYDCQKGNLCTLSFRVYENINRVRKDLQFNLEKLSDCQKLCSLDFEGQVANVRPFQFPPNLTTLTLSRTRIGDGVDLMEALGRLSVLKYLTLEKCAFSGKKLSCARSTAFPQLQQLVFEHMYDLEEWEMEIGAMKALKKIWIKTLPGLKKLPECIRYIDTLEEFKALSMPEDFCARLEHENGSPDVIYEDEYDIIKNIPSVEVRDTYKELRVRWDHRTEAKGHGPDFLPNDI